MKIVIIGGGPGGYVAAVRAAQLGGEVTLIEKNLLGGTCLNVGCIPTKVLLHVSELLEQLRDGSRWGVETESSYVEWSRVQKKKGEIVKKLTSGVAGLMKANNVNVISGTAVFIDSKTLQVTGPDGKVQKLCGDRIIVAAGSVPVIPPIEGMKDNPSCIDSTGALSLKSVPESLLVIGGGVVGIELASAYHGLGSKVTVIEAMPGILPMMDGELTERFLSLLRKKGIEVYTNAKVRSVQQVRNRASVSVDTEDKSLQFTAEKVLTAVGRRADIEALGLDAAGISYDRGGILVNDRMETTVPGIYAIGDCLGKIMLAHTAARQGEIAAENAMGQKSCYDGRTSPSCIYTTPEFAGVGLTEEMAVQKNIPVDIARFPLSANGKAMIMHGEEGMVKLLFGRQYGEILGAHILGPRATDMIGELALALNLEVTAEELIATIHAHPTVSEAIRECAMAAEKRAIHIVNR